MSRREPPSPLSDAAWLEALGIRDASDAEVSEAPNRDEVLAAEAVVGEMAHAGEATPAASLRDRLIAAVAAEPDPGRPIVVRGHETDWFPLGPPGIMRRNLYIDPATKIGSFLIRMEPGALFPSHHHSGVEECYVLEGTVTDSDTTVGSGDYVRYAPSTRHDVFTTDTGCLLLIVGPSENVRVP